MAFNENNKNEFTNIGQNTNAPVNPAAPQGFAPNTASTAAPNVPPQFQAQPQMQQAAQPQMNTQPNVNTPKPGLTNGKGLLGGLANRYSMTRHALGQIAIEFLESYKKIVKQEQGMQRADWNLHAFDGEQNDVAISGVVLSLCVDDFVAYYPIFINATCMEIPDKIIPGNGNIPQVNIPRLPEELWSTDVVLAKAVARFIKSNYPDKKLLEVGALFLPEELETTNMAQLRSNLYYAVEAIETTLYTAAGQTDATINLAHKADNENISQSVRFYDNAQAADATGLPVRSDIEISLKVNSRTPQNIHTGARTSRLLSIARGYIGLTFTGLPPIPAMNLNYMTPGTKFPAPFEPSFIINSLDNQTDGATLETQLLALATTAALVNNSLWTTALKPNYSITTPGADRRDIGALTIAVNDQGAELGYTNTKTDASFNLPAFLARFIDSSLKFQIDIREVGELTHVQRVFLDTIPEINNSAEANAAAYQLIVDAANRLTNGHFSKYWTSNNPFVFYDGNRVELGHYTDEKNELRDLHEVDFVALLNKVGDNGQTAFEYMDSFNPNIGPMEYRLSKRLRIYQTYFPTFKLTGFARRLWINHEFLLALGAAIKDAAGFISLETPTGMDQVIERGYRNNIIGLSANQSNIFIQQSFGNGYGYPQTPNGFAPTNFRNFGLYAMNPNGINLNGVGY